MFWMTFYKLISWSECQTGGYQLFKNIGLTWVPVRNRCSGPACHSCFGGPGNARNQLPLRKCADPGENHCLRLQGNWIKMTRMLNVKQELAMDESGE